jgi:hypothetical protein
MCWCNSNIRTPTCASPFCVPPEMRDELVKASGAQMMALHKPSDAQKIAQLEARMAVLESRIGKIEESI